MKPEKCILLLLTLAQLTTVLAQKNKKVAEPPACFTTTWTSYKNIPVNAELFDLERPYSMLNTLSGVSNRIEVNYKGIEDGEENLIRENIGSLVNIPGMRFRTTDYYFPLVNVNGEDSVIYDAIGEWTTVYAPRDTSFHLILTADELVVRRDRQENGAMKITEISLRKQFGGKVGPVTVFAISWDELLRSGASGFITEFDPKNYPGDLFAEVEKVVSDEEQFGKAINTLTSAIFYPEAAHRRLTFLDDIPDHVRPTDWVPALETRIVKADWPYVSLLDAGDSTYFDPETEMWVNAFPAPDTLYFMRKGFHTTWLYESMTYDSVAAGWVIQPVELLFSHNVPGKKPLQVLSCAVTGDNPGPLSDYFTNLPRKRFDSMLWMTMLQEDKFTGYRFLQVVCGEPVRY